MKANPFQILLVLLVLVACPLVCAGAVVSLIQQGNQGRLITLNMKQSENLGDALELAKDQHQTIRELIDMVQQRDTAIFAGFLVDQLTSIAIALALFALVVALLVVLFLVVRHSLEGENYVSK